jgi:predicted RNA-binding protein with PUA domain
MWSNQKMKSTTFIRSDDVKCFHVVVKGTHKLVVMGHINFEDHVLIKRWRVDENMNGASRMFKDMKKWRNPQKQFAFVVQSCAHF